MPPRKLYFENVRVGDELPAMAKSPVDRVQLARFAGATNDYNPLQIDEVHAKSLGMPSVYAPSLLGMSFLGQLVGDWARAATLKKFAVKFIKLVWPGDTLVCKGRVSDTHGDGGKYFVDLDVWAENQKGELVLKGTATLQVYFSSEDENRQKAGQPPLVVQVARSSILAPPEAGAQKAKKGKKPKKAAAAKKPKKAKKAKAPKKPKKGKPAKRPKPASMARKPLKSKKKR
jgi:acyl dehydratase